MSSDKTNEGESRIIESNGKMCIRFHDREKFSVDPESQNHSLLQLDFSDFKCEDGSSLGEKDLIGEGIDDGVGCEHDEGTGDLRSKTYFSKVVALTRRCTLEKMQAERNEKAALEKARSEYEKFRRMAGVMRAGSFEAWCEKKKKASVGKEGCTSEFFRLKEPEEKDKTRSACRKRSMVVFNVALNPLGPSGTKFFVDVGEERWEEKLISAVSKTISLFSGQRLIAEECALYKDGRTLGDYQKNQCRKEEMLLHVPTLVHLRSRTFDLSALVERMMCEENPYAPVELPIHCGKYSMKAPSEYAAYCASVARAFWKGFLYSEAPRSGKFGSLTALVSPGTASSPSPSCPKKRPGNDDDDDGTADSPFSKEEENGNAEIYHEGVDKTKMEEACARLARESALAEIPKKYGGNFDYFCEFHGVSPSKVMREFGFAAWVVLKELEGTGENAARFSRIVKDLRGQRKRKLALFMKYARELSGSKWVKLNKDNVFVMRKRKKKEKEGSDIEGEGKKNAGDEESETPGEETPSEDETFVASNIQLVNTLEKEITSIEKKLERELFEKNKEFHLVCSRNEENAIVAFENAFVSSRTDAEEEYSVALAALGVRSELEPSRNAYLPGSASLEGEKGSNFAEGRDFSPRSEGDDYGDDEEMEERDDDDLDFALGPSPLQRDPYRTVPSSISEDVPFDSLPLDNDNSFLQKRETTGKGDGGRYGDVPSAKKISGEKKPPAKDLDYSDPKYLGEEKNLDKVSTDERSTVYALRNPEEFPEPRNSVIGIAKKGGMAGDGSERPPRKTKAASQIVDKTIRDANASSSKKYNSGGEEITEDDEYEYDKLKLGDPSERRKVTINYPVGYKKTNTPEGIKRRNIVTGSLILNPFSATSWGQHPSSDTSKIKAVVSATLFRKMEEELSKKRREAKKTGGNDSGFFNLNKERVLLSSPYFQSYEDDKKSTLGVKDASFRKESLSMKNEAPTNPAMSKGKDFKTSSSPSSSSISPPPLKEVVGDKRVPPEYPPPKASMSVSGEIPQKTPSGSTMPKAYKVDCNSCSLSRAKKPMRNNPGATRGKNANTPDKKEEGPTPLMKLSVTVAKSVSDTGRIRGSIIPALFKDSNLPERIRLKFLSTTIFQGLTLNAKTGNGVGLFYETNGGYVSALRMLEFSKGRKTYTKEGEEKGWEREVVNIVTRRRTSGKASLKFDNGGKSRDAFETNSSGATVKYDARSGSTKMVVSGKFEPYESLILSMFVYSPSSYKGEEEGVSSSDGDGDSSSGDADETNSFEGKYRKSTERFGISKEWALMIFHPEENRASIIKYLDGGE